MEINYPNLELALKIEEDIAHYLDALKFIGGPSSLAISASPSYDAKRPSNSTISNKINTDEILF